MLPYEESIKPGAFVDKYIRLGKVERAKAYNEQIAQCLRHKMQLPQPASFGLNTLDLKMELLTGFVELLIPIDDEVFIDPQWNQQRFQHPIR